MLSWQCCHLLEFLLKPRNETKKKKLSKKSLINFRRQEGRIKYLCQQSLHAVTALTTEASSTLKSTELLLHLFSCFCSRSRRVSSWLRCCRLRLCSGVLRGGEVTLQLGTSWYWPPPPRLSPQKLKMLDTPEKAPAGEQREDVMLGGRWGFCAAVWRFDVYLTGRCRCCQSWGRCRPLCSH